MSVVIIILMFFAFVFGALTAFAISYSIFGKIIGTIFIGFLYFLVGGGIIVFALDGILYQIADKKETPIKTYIYGIDMKAANSKGTFFLGCGTIENDYRYSYYVKTKDSSFKLDDVSAKKTTIVEDEEVQPYIMKWKSVEVVNKEAWKNWFTRMKKDVEVDSVEIHVPKGTILQEMKGGL